MEYPLSPSFSARSGSTSTSASSSTTASISLTSLPSYTFTSMPTTPLTPSWYLTRPNGSIVPVIPVDQIDLPEGYSLNVHLGTGLDCEADNNNNNININSSSSSSSSSSSQPHTPTSPNSGARMAVNLGRFSHPTRTGGLHSGSVSPTSPTSPNFPSPSPSSPSPISAPLPRPSPLPVRTPFNTNPASHHGPILSISTSLPNTYDSLSSSPSSSSSSSSSSIPTPTSATATITSIHHHIRPKLTVRTDSGWGANPRIGPELGNHHDLVTVDHENEDGHQQEQNTHTAIEPEMPESLRSWPQFHNNPNLTIQHLPIPPSDHGIEIEIDINEDEDESASIFCWDSDPDQDDSDLDEQIINTANSDTNRPPFQVAPRSRSQDYSNFLYIDCQVQTDNSRHDLENRHNFNYHHSPIYHDQHVESHVFDDHGDDKRANIEYLESYMDLQELPFISPSNSFFAAAQRSSPSPAPAPTPTPTHDHDLSFGSACTVPFLYMIPPSTNTIPPTASRPRTAVKIDHHHRQHTQVDTNSENIPKPVPYQNTFSYPSLPTSTVNKGHTTRTTSTSTTIITANKPRSQTPFHPHLYPHLSSEPKSGLITITPETYRRNRYEQVLSTLAVVGGGLEIRFEDIDNDTNDHDPGNGYYGHRSRDYYDAYNGGYYNDDESECMSEYRDEYHTYPS